jgi:hypothetical protein
VVQSVEHFQKVPHQSMSENDFECFASTGVNAPGQYFLILADAEAKFL